MQFHASNLAFYYTNVTQWPHNNNSLIVFKCYKKNNYIKYICSPESVWAKITSLTTVFPKIRSFAKQTVFFYFNVENLLLEQ